MNVFFAALEGVLSIAKLSATDRDACLYELLESPEEAKRLVTVLFTTLKQSIHSRRKPSSDGNGLSNQPNEEAAAPIKEKRNVKVIPGEGDVNLENAGGSSIQSQASRLVDKSLNHSKTDQTAIISVLCCLQALLVSDSSPIAKAGPFYADPFRSLICATSKEWLRLLLTLSHASMVEIAEPAAAILFHIIINSGGWSRASDLVIENIALVVFLSCSNCSIDSSRFELAASYLYYLLDKDSSHDVGKTEFDSLKCDVVASIVFDQDCLLLKAFLSWLQQAEIHVTYQLIAIRAIALLVQAKKFHDVLNKFGMMKK